jgi:hypothetical protein
LGLIHAFSQAVTCGWLFAAPELLVRLLDRYRLLLILACANAVPAYCGIGTVHLKAPRFSLEISLVQKADWVARIEET